VVSSLSSVFDDFGSAIFVPEAGFTLNNRAAGFTGPPNDAGPKKQPVHTLSPIIAGIEGSVVALATPGADGQVQTLLQILVAQRAHHIGLAEAIVRPRWRSEGGRVLIERSHPAINALRERGHELFILDDGDPRFGAVVCAGFSEDGPFATSDWRRQACAVIA
jgi:gamma-glutamyltranspeptidase/glutathione hydrolase